MSKPSVSIVMPVYNTGSYLREAIQSVMDQEPFEGAPVPTYELLIVDDASTDAETLGLLEVAASMAGVRVERNRHHKGASGARNTGIELANGEWIGFLDSDDLYLPHALAARWRFIAENRSVKWVAAHFFLMRPETGIERTPLSKRSPTFHALMGDDHAAGRPTCLPAPVELLTRNCILGILTVLVRRDLILERGMFDERLKRAEDYHLWFKLAIDTDLWVLPYDIAIYRLRPGSLSRGNEPIFYHEHTMVELLLADPSFARFRELLTRRLDFVLLDYCQFYRKTGQFPAARRWALFWVRRRPFALGAWKQLLAVTLGI